MKALILLAVVVLLLLAPAQLNAAPTAAILVTTTLESPGNSGDCTLGEAIWAANTDTAVDACAAGSGADTITLPAGTYIFVGVGDNSAGLSALPLITSTISLNGAGDGNTLLQSENSEASKRILNISAQGVLTVTGVTLDNGILDSYVGGDILNSGTLDLEASTVSHGVATSAGAIYNTGTLTVSNSQLLGNSASIYAAGIWNHGGTITLSNSIVSNNSPHDLDTMGGGIYNDNGGTITVAHSTFSENHAQGGGAVLNSSGTVTIQESSVHDNVAQSAGGLWNSATMTIINTTIARNVAASYACGGVCNGGTLHLTNVTIADNQAQGDSAGLLNNGGTVTLQNSIITRNTVEGTPSNCGYQVTSLGHNLIDNRSSCNLNHRTDDIVANPSLAAFTNKSTAGNGHYPLKLNSPAINTADASACSPEDQIGHARRNTCDIGAIEFTGNCPTSPDAPVPLAPVDGATGISKNPVLDWSSSKCAEQYKIVVRQGSEHGTVILNLSGLIVSQTRLQALKKGKPYFWRVQTCITSNCAKSAWQHFTVN